MLYLISIICTQQSSRISIIVLYFLKESLDKMSIWDYPYFMSNLNVAKGVKLVKPSHQYKNSGWTFQDVTGRH